MNSNITENSMLDAEVSYFETCFGESSQTFLLREWLNDKSLEEAVKIIREEPDEEKQKELKRCLPGVTISGIFKRRAKSELLKHSGLISVDIDLKDNQHIKNFSWEKTARQTLEILEEVAKKG